MSLRVKIPTSIVGCAQHDRQPTDVVVHHVSGGLAGGAVFVHEFRRARDEFLEQANARDLGVE